MLKRYPWGLEPRAFRSLGVELYPTAIFPYATLMFKFCIIRIATSRPTAGHSVSMTAKRCAICTAKNDYSKEREQLDKLGVVSTKRGGRCQEECAGGTTTFCTRHTAAEVIRVIVPKCSVCRLLIENFAALSYEICNSYFCVSILCIPHWWGKAEKPMLCRQLKNILNAWQYKISASDGCLFLATDTDPKLF